MKKTIISTASTIGVLLIVYFLGPAAPKPLVDATISVETVGIQELEKNVIETENQVIGLKPGNEARIVWFNPSQKQKTKFSVVYLHGLSGSQADGDPIHVEFAKRYGCNLYLSRLYGHGIASDNALQDLTPENYLESAKHAVSIGKCLGEKVILMATSTGGSLALIIASANPEIAGLILYSPNIDFRDNSSFMLIRPWGLQIARIVQRSSSMESDDPKNVQMYWQSRYRLEALVSVKALLNATMNKSTFARIKQPIFVGYYYKNDVEQDNRVSVVRILQMFEQVETPVALKRQISFPNAGVHPIASSIVSKDICTVRLETFAFAEDILGLVPIAVSTKD